MAIPQLARPNSEAAIFARLWEGKDGGLTVPLARHVLKLGFDENDTVRMHELAEKNRRGQLTATERDELDNFVRVGDLLAILQSKARKRLHGSNHPAVLSRGAAVDA